MRLGIDLSPFFTNSEHRGNERFAKGMLETLVRIDEKDQFHFLNIFGEYQADLDLNERCYLHRYNCGPFLKEEHKFILSDPSLMDYFHAISDHFIASSKIDAMLFMSMPENSDCFQAEWFSGVYKIGVLQDCISQRYEDEDLGNVEGSESCFSSLEFAKKMDLLLATSESCKQDAIRLLNIAPTKVLVIQAGVDSQFISAAKRVHLPLADKLLRKNPYILFNGGFSSRENFAKAMQAFAANQAAKERKLRFVIVGGLSESLSAYLRDYAIQNGVQDRVVLADDSNDQKRLALYQHAVAFLFLPEQEGIGLPVLEAMCCGTAVITTNTSVIQEADKGCAYFVDPNHIESISAGITKLLENCRGTELMVRSAKKYAQAFQWERVAKDVHEGIQQLLQTPLQGIRTLTPLSVNSKFLRQIAGQYEKYSLTYRWPDALALAKEMLRLEQAQPSEGNQQGSRILFDVTVGHAYLRTKSGAGIIRVSEHLRKAMSSFGQVIPVTLKNHNGKCVLVKVNMETYLEESVIEVQAGDIYLMAEIQVRGIHVPANYPSVLQLREKGVKAFVVLYDLLPIQMPQYFGSAMSTGFLGYINEALRNYDGVLTDSRTVADDVLQYYKARSIEIGRKEKLRIGYFHLGMDSFRDIKRSVPFSIKTIFKGPQSVFLMVGTIEPRKGHELVLQTFTRLWQGGAEYKLCMIGSVGWMTEALIQQIKNHPEIGHKLFFYENAGDHMLEYAYQHASALIQASEGEGFGLPIIEAACYSLPLLCSDIPVFHEIAGEYALYFKRETEMLADCINEFEFARRSGQVLDTSKIELLTWNDVAKRVFMMMKHDLDWTYFE